jgi:hypothetical protein
MIKVENIETWGFEHAIRGMRNPMNSWDKSDSTIGMIQGYKVEYHIGKNDLDLMHRLYEAGHPHRKYLRQIFVSMDITAPLYWWKEFDTYKVGTTANSCSTMHKIHSKEFELDDFSHEHLEEHNLRILKSVIDALNTERENYNFGKLKSQWWQMIQLLPSSYNQTRTITMNYENVVNIIQYRTGHKLDEWNEFVEILSKLPHLEDIAKGESNE